MVNIYEHPSTDGCFVFPFDPHPSAIGSSIARLSLGPGFLGEFINERDDFVIDHAARARRSLSSESLCGTIVPGPTVGSSQFGRYVFRVVFRYIGERRDAQPILVRFACTIRV